MHVSKKDVQINLLEKKINYKFISTALLKTALTHSSYSNESKKLIPYNERLEFLGDSVLNLIITEYLYKGYPSLPEGDLTKIRSFIISEVSLAKAAKEISLGDFLLLGKGERANGGQQRSSILADTLEAIIGAVFLDGSLENAKKTVLTILEKNIKQTLQGENFRDYKTDLQEILQKKSTDEIVYKIIKELGPDHDKRFIAKIFHGVFDMGTGIGRSKKEAEQHAAKKALEKIHD